MNEAATGQAEVRVADALTYVERQLALARDYQSAAIVKAASEYLRYMEKEVASLRSDLADIKGQVASIANDNKAETAAAREMRLSAESA